MPQLSSRAYSWGGSLPTIRAVIQTQATCQEPRPDAFFDFEYLRHTFAIPSPYLRLIALFSFPHISTQFGGFPQGYPLLIGANSLTSDLAICLNPKRKWPPSPKGGHFRKLFSRLGTSGIQNTAILSPPVSPCQVFFKFPGWPHSVTLNRSLLRIERG